MALRPTRSECEGFGEVLYLQWNGWGLTVICYGIAVKRRGMSEVSVRKMKTLTMKMGTVTLIAKGS